ncbi:GroES-like protein [Auriculariales sp. MPI-PUGE-AT-0066]|nr:GroES-like protein [Auriculariales sp. MPI-PUGE-AT-0066]
MTSLPQLQSKLAVVDAGKVEVQSKPLPVLEPDTVLVRVQAVSLNPTDWKHIDRLLKPGASTGSDFAGVVAALGTDADNKGLKVGDAVAGFTRGGFLADDNGAFQEYVRQHPELLWKKPDSISFEDAAPMGGIALSTAVQALYYRLNVPTPWSGSPAPSTPILIWSGATGVGLYAIQLAHAAGFRVAATASTRNHELLKKLGANFVIPYNEEGVSEKLKAWADEFGGFRHAIDTISEFGSTKLAAAAMSDQGGEIIRLLNNQEEEKGVPKNVKVTPILIYSVLKKKNQRDFEEAAEWYQHLPDLVATGKIKPVPRKHFDGGLAAVPQGLEYLRSGKASGEKVTFTLGYADSATASASAHL